MAPDAVERKLAAILSADVVGYSRLMAEDEAGTVRRLTAYRDQIATLVREHRGRVVDSPGDNVLAEFPTATDAVSCAVEIQGVLAARNAPLPEAQKMKFRIGVHLGEIRLEGERIYGDGVNIASRLEGLAPPGGIYVSSTVHEQVEKKLNVALEDLGERTLKNIPRPIHVYGVKLLLPEAQPESRLLPGHDDLTVPGFEGRPAIAILPFDNLSGDPEQEYFADGISEDLITDLSRVSGLFVIARNSSFAYKGKPVDVREACRELGVSHVLGGSVRRSGSRVRISAQLAEGASGRHLWAERYDRDLNDLFAVQDDVTRKIVVALQVKLTDREIGQLAGRGTTNLEAYDHFLQAREYYWIHTKESNAAAEELLRQTIDLDPYFSAPYSMFAHLLVVDYVNDWVDRPERLLSRAEELATKAVELDPSDAYAHMELGAVYLWMRRHELAISEGEKSIALDSNFARGYAFLATALHYTGRFEEAITRIRTAMRLDPHYPDRDLHFLAQNYYALGRFQEAIDTLRQRLVRNPDTDVSRVLLASAYGHLGLFEEARGEWEEALRINPNYSLQQRRSVLPYKDRKYFDRIADGLRKAGLKE